VLATAAQYLLLAAEEEERTGLDLVLPEPAELVGGALAFLFVAVILGWKVWPKIREAVQKREDTIQGQFEDAEKAKAEAEQAKRNYEEQIADARSEANRIIEEARQSAESVRKDLITKAEAEAKQVVDKAQDQIEQERQRTVQELQGSIADLSIELAERVVGKSLDAPAQRELVDSYIRDVSGMQSPNGGSR
jgi:F-type H+-transporting ATPase subunit b